jgi:hypothetical protein
MRWLLPMTMTMLLGAYASACGGTGKGAGSVPRASASAAARSTPPAVASVKGAGLGTLKGDGDDDETSSTYDPKNKTMDDDGDFDIDPKAGESENYYDSDDSSIRHYGQAAMAADSRAITALVKRYYAAASAADGTGACSLMYPQFAAAVPEDYGSGAGPVYSRGNTCAVVMSKLFQHLHGELATAITVISVRVKGDQAIALIGSQVARAGSLSLKRERGAWKVDALLAIPLQ